MKKITKVINGVEYTAVWNGLNFSNERIKQCKLKGTDTISTYRLSKVVFSDIIINPKVNVDDFLDVQEFYDVLNFGKSVLFGEFEENKSKGKLKQDVLDEWGAWRLIYCEMSNFDYNTVFNQMTPQEINKANIALDIVNEEIKRQSKKK